ncbi:MAG: acetate--CoA ligase family protein [Candidatus Lokiarchaeota archaeon]|nr:acetate--CoA ligase family protein [Candidatus Lokiarchaeota archaeon]
MEIVENKDIGIKDISFINNIRSIAVIGASKKRDYFFLRNHQYMLKGNIYAVHPNAEEIPNFPTENIYASILDIPEAIDFAFIAVPAKSVLEVIDECVVKGVKLVTIFTSEFSDAGTEKGVELEKELLRRTKNKVRILGPNGLGLFYPKLGIAWRQGFPRVSGNIGFIAQSGGICNIAIYSSFELGINFSKVFSFGNGADLDVVDLLSFLINDPETEIILCYLEGIKEGRIDTLRAILKNNTKPIIVLKGGKSEIGAIAAKTHTASISGDNKIWKNFFRQYNLIEVDSLEELLYTARLIDCYGVFKLENLAIISISGGYGVVLTDLIEKSGLEVPPFPPKIQHEISKRFFMAGTSPNNPLDFAAQFFAINIVKEVIDIILSDKGIDGLIIDMPGFYLTLSPRVKDSEAFFKIMLESLNLGHKHNKPLILIMQHLTRPKTINEFLTKIKENKIAIFGDPQEFLPILPKISTFNEKLNKKSH